MGIKSLLKNTKSVSKRRHISHYRNKTVAIDGFAWIHRASYNCPEEVIFEKNIRGIFKFFQQKMAYLLQLNINIILVFDGAEAPLKKQTN